MTLTNHASLATSDISVVALILETLVKLLTLDLSFPVIKMGRLDMIPLCSPKRPEYLAGKGNFLFLTTGALAPGQPGAKGERECEQKISRVLFRWGQ